MTTKTLQDQIEAAADAELQAKINARLEPIRSQVARLPAVEFEANDPAQSAQKIKVSMTPAELIDIVGLAAFAHRRDQARLKRTRDFLDKVAAAGIEP